MSEPIITIRDLSKKYRITHHRGGYVALRDIMANALRHPLNFIFHKARKILGKNTKEEFWALKDINLEIERGEAIGIIGANGAGKSTLLKILSRITPPSTGEIVMSGRASSLLEVGTGFHPELTGRENIFLNGAILGMTRREMAKKFDEIVAFSGVEKFLDTPVKYYSSGMYVRLAFSVAAHMEPDILIVDEVLAVGDAEFQKKCLGKMDEVTKTAGRTVLFVSHNMSAIRQLCGRAVLLEGGKIKMVGEANEVVDRYLESNPLYQGEDALRGRRDRKGKGRIKLISFFVEDEEGNKVSFLKTGGLYSFYFGYETADGNPAKNLHLSSAILDESNRSLALNNNKMTDQKFPVAPAKGLIKCRIKQKFPFTKGTYYVSGDLFSNDEREDFIRNLAAFEVKDGDFYGTGFITDHSPFCLDQDWEIREIS
jgi:lipopolysaccharide transport system ATP-binding protein